VCPDQVAAQEVRLGNGGALVLLEERRAVTAGQANRLASGRPLRDAYAGLGQRRPVLVCDHHEQRRSYVRRYAAGPVEAEPSGDRAATTGCQSG
jgi:hypothetical protein